MEKLGNNIKLLRKQKKISQSDLGEMLGVSQTSVAHYEAGTREPNIETLVSLSQIFNESIDSLTGNSSSGINKDIKIDDLNELSNTLLNSLLVKDERLFFQLFEEEILNNYSIEIIVDNIFKNILYKIGTLWEMGKVTEGDEHYATNLIRKAMNYLSVRNVNLLKDKVSVSFSVGSEKHTLGIEMINTYLESIGVKSIYLGSSVPLKGLGELLEKYHPNFIFISITMADHINHLLAILDYLTEKFPKEFMIAIGGQGITNREKLIQYDNVVLIESMNDLNQFVNNEME